MSNCTKHGHTFGCVECERQRLTAAALSGERALAELDAERAAHAEMQAALAKAREALRIARTALALLREQRWSYECSVTAERALRDLDAIAGDAP